MQSVPEIGETLVDRYYVEEILSVGQRTATFKCFDMRLDVECVVKMLLGDSTAEDWNKTRESFIESFRVQARLNHPNIVHVANIEMKKGAAMSVMELLQGMTLEQYICTEKLGAKEFIELFLSIVDAVSMAHSMGIIHKSISPKHIFLNEQGSRLSPRILDFAASYDPAESDVSSVLPYLAPEQLESFDNATEASDVFSLCATMFYAFAGTSPVLCESLSEYIEFYRDNAGELIFPDTIPVEFVPLIQVGLSADPESRFKNATELLKALKQLGKGFKLSANLSIEASKSYPAISGIDSDDSSQVGNKKASMTPSRPHPAVTPSRPHPAVTPSKPLVVPCLNSGSGKSSELEQLSIHSGKLSSSASQSILSPFRAAGDSQSVQPKNPSSILRNLAPNASVPSDLEGVYKIRRLDSVNSHAWIGAVSTSENPDELYVIKCFLDKDEIASAVFNEGTRRTEILSRENSFFQSVYARYTDASAFLMADMKRQDLIACIGENGVFKPIVAVQIAVLIGQAMEYAHQRGFVNGNLKPSNIIFENRDGVITPVIYDFGQRLYVSSYEQLEMTDLPFIAPELKFNLQNSNAQTDIYAFGMLLCYMLTARLPYHSTKLQDLALEILNCTELPDISKLRPGVPPELIQIIRWCCEFEPSKRYVRFGDVLQDLYVVFQSLSK